MSCARSDHMHLKCISTPPRQESAYQGDKEASVRFQAPENVLRHCHVKSCREEIHLMSGEAGTLWTHGIAARQFDEVHSRSEMLGSTASAQFYQPSQTSQSRATTSTVLPRGIRTSLTFIIGKFREDLAFVFVVSV